MTYIDNLLATVFSANVAESGEVRRACLNRIATSDDPRQRDGLRGELSAALANENYDWDAQFDRHDVDIAEGRSPRDFVVGEIWTPLFGAELPATAPSASR